MGLRCKGPIFYSTVSYYSFYCIPSLLFTWGVMFTAVGLT